MKTKIVSLIISLLITLSSHSQNIADDFNLNFENIKNEFPTGWQNVGSSNYTFFLNKEEFNSVVPVMEISSDSSSLDDVGFLTLDIPDNFDGKVLNFEAQIKTIGIEKGGTCGLFIGIQPKVASQNMEDLELNGDNDWNVYSIKVNLSPKETKKIVLGLYLRGRGKVLFKDLKLRIDSKDYTNTRLYIPKNIEDTIYSFKSNFPKIKLTSSVLNKLKTTAQIWGLLKYFHPKITTHNWDMDTELFKFLSKINKYNTNEEFDEALHNWIDQFGEIKINSIEGKDSSSMLQHKPDFKWIKELPYSKSLKNKLFLLSRSYQNKDNKYIDYFEGAKHPKISEYSYSAISIEDDGFRLLGLFRYWNIIQYYYPYKYMLSENWEKQLETFIPLFLNASNYKELDKSYLKLFSKIMDTHAFSILSSDYNSVVFGERKVDLDVKIIENKVVVADVGADNIKFKELIKVGDIILKVNDIHSLDRVRFLRKFIAASNELVALRDISKAFLQTNLEFLDLTIARNGQVMNSTLPTRKITEINPIKTNIDTSFKIINNEVAYINFENFKGDSVKEIYNSIQNTKGLILDYRGYPKAENHELFSNYLFPNKKAFVKFTKNEGLSPGEFKFRETLFVGENNPNHYKGKVVILVNENTQSAAEFQVMAFQTIPGAIVIGPGTSGADGNISWIPLPYGYKTAFSGIGVFYPDGRETQGSGIIPDMKIFPTLDGIKNGKDELLEKAINYLKDIK